MGKAAEAMAGVVEGCYANVVARAFEAVEGSSDPVRTGLEAAVAMAETNPAAALTVVWRLQGDWEVWEMLEDILGGQRPEATLRIGAALQMVRAELRSPAPQLRRRIPELMELLGRRQLHAVE